MTAPKDKGKTDNQGEQQGGEDQQAPREDAKRPTARERAEAAAAEAEAMLGPARNFHNVVPGVNPVGINDGYHPVTLKNGVVQYYADHDGWNTPDQAVIQAHVADYRARKAGGVSG